MKWGMKNEGINESRGQHCNSGDSGEARRETSNRASNWMATGHGSYIDMARSGRIVEIGPGGELVNK